jgi:Ca2+/Na+ antiporter
MWLWIVQFVLSTLSLVFYFMYKGNSQIIESWMLFYSMNFYAMAGYYAFYTKEYNTWDKKTNSFREESSAKTLTTDYSVVDRGNRESLLDDATFDLSDRSRVDKIRAKKLEKLWESQEKITDRFKVFDLEQDTYSMAFRALHKKSCDLMELTDDEWRSALKSAFLVFAMQTILLYIIYWTLFASPITSPGHVMTMGARFICCLLMHL